MHTAPPPAVRGRSGRGTPARSPRAGAGFALGRGLAAFVTGVALLAVVVAPASAKEYLLARLEAPISFQSPPGSTLLVAVDVTVPDGTNQDPVDGSPISLRLIGPRGDVTEAPGRTGSRTGRYEMRITVPPGGPRRLEVFLRGSSDLPIMLEENPFTFRPIGPGTAQLAPPLSAASAGARAIVPNPPVPVVRPAGDPAAQPAAKPPAQPAAQPAAQPVPPAAPLGPVVPAVAPLAALLSIAALGCLALAALIAWRRGRSRGRPGSAPVPAAADAPGVHPGS
jgi:hypothetical protein